MVGVIDMAQEKGIGPKTPWTIQTAYLILLLSLVFAAGGAWSKACNHDHDERYTASATLKVQMDALATEVEHTREDTKAMRSILEARYGRAD